MNRFWLLGFLVFAACTRTTTLTGCVLPSETSGPGSDAVVIVVPASEAFEAEWQRILTAFGRDYDAARAAYVDARSRYGAARNAEQTGMRAQREALKTMPTRVREDPVTGARVWSNQTPPSVWGLAQARSDAARAMAEAGQRLSGAIDIHAAAAIAAIERHGAVTTRTDGRGCFGVKRVPLQPVYVFVNHGDRYWLREVDASHGPATVDFTPDRSRWPFAAVVRPG